MDEVRALISQAREKLQTRSGEPAAPGDFYVWTEPPVQPGATFGFPRDVRTPPSTNERGESVVETSNSEPESPGRGSVGSVTVQEQGHVPASGPRRVKLRIAATPPASDKPRRLRLITDGARCQDLVLRFKEAEGQGRYPLPVSHITGAQGYGCDVLSFSSSEMRERFQNQPDLDLVERFIEVKGRGSERGAIELKGNELLAAQKYGDRYHLYRVYEAGPSEFDVTVLANPANAPWRNVVYEIDLAREDMTTRWFVSEIAEQQSSENESDS